MKTPKSLVRLASRPAAFALAAVVSPLAARAGYAWNFPTTVTPIARGTLRTHNEFMLIITGLFVVVFAIMIYSMIAHRKRSGHVAAKFTGKLQWFWTLVPFAILLFIDFVVMGVPAFRAVVAMEDTQTKADLVLKATGMQREWQDESPDSGIKHVGTLATPRERVRPAQIKALRQRAPEAS